MCEEEQRLVTVGDLIVHEMWQREVNAALCR